MLFHCLRLLIVKWFVLFAVVLNLNHNNNTVHVVLAIIGGRNVAADEAHFVVQVFSKPPRQGHCTGVIIGADTVLTAAHCTEDTKPADLLVIYGTDQYFKGTDHRTSTNITTETSENFRKVSVHSVHTHPYWTEPTDRQYDLSVLRLSARILPNPRTRSLPIAWDYSGVHCDSRATVYGFGNVDTKGRDPDRLQALQTAVINHCARNWLFDLLRYGSPLYSVALQELESRFVVTERANSTACDGDSGAPLVSDDGELLGLLSHNLQLNRDSCEPGDVTYFVRVVDHWRFLRPYL